MHAAAGELDAAFAALAEIDPAYHDRHWLAVDPNLAALRADPRWPASAGA
jgi:hypothetical protein